MLDNCVHYLYSVTVFTHITPDLVSVHFLLFITTFPQCILLKKLGCYLIHIHNFVNKQVSTSFICSC